MYAVLKFLSLISQYSHKLMGTTVCSLLPFSVHAFHYNRYCCGYGTVLVCRNEIHMWPHTIIITIIISYFLSISLFFGFLFRLCLLFLLPSCGVVFFRFVSPLQTHFSVFRVVVIVYVAQNILFCHISNRLLFFSHIWYFKSFKPNHWLFLSRSECTVRFSICCHFKFHHFLPLHSHSNQIERLVAIIVSSNNYKLIEVKFCGAQKKWAWVINNDCFPSSDKIKTRMRLFWCFQWILAT